MIYADASGDIVASAKMKKGSVAWTLVKDVTLPTAPLLQVGGMRQVQLRFGVTSGDWRVDDVLIDPRMRS
jgi:hypothetical protein